jgi:hypothetical protein
VSGRLILILSAVAVVLVTQAFVVTPSARALAENPDNRPWMTNGKVYATALSEDESTLYIGGRFTQVRENPPGEGGKTLSVDNVAAIDVARGAPISDWHPRVTGDGATVYSLAVEGGRVFIGGNFTAVGGTPRKNLAEVSAENGAVRPFAPAVGDAASVVRTLLTDNSRLYIGGDFAQIAEGDKVFTRGKLAAFNLATDQLDQEWKPRTSNTVRDLEFGATGNTIFVAGAFSSITGSDGTQEVRQSVARVYADTGDLHPWKIPSGTIEDPMTAWDITATSARLYGGFGRAANYAAAFRLDRDNRGSRVWRFNTTGNVQTVALSANGSRLFIGGHFGIANKEHQVCGRDYLRGLGSLDPTTGSINCHWLPGVEGPVPNYEGIRDMAVTRSYLWVGGGFTGISAAEQHNLARFTL